VNNCEVRPGDFIVVLAQAVKEAPRATFTILNRVDTARGEFFRSIKKRGAEGRSFAAFSGGREAE
jgi:hypothetical protein